MSSLTNVKEQFKWKCQREFYILAVANMSFSTGQADSQVLCYRATVCVVIVIS